MQRRYHKYFWDSKDGWSDCYILPRIIESASFPDLISYPFDEVKKYIDKIPLHKLWTGEKRKHFMIVLKPYIHISTSWEEAIQKLMDDNIGKFKKRMIG
ncbi:MAG: hypothetical protein HY738_19830 [Bacteroidia bacterium]|nr:hypothetical protein [Bacteroidia bacterium]